MNFNFNKIKINWTSNLLFFSANSIPWFLLGLLPKTTTSNISCPNCTTSCIYSCVDFSVTVRQTTWECVSDGCKQRQLLCPNCQVLHVACRRNSMYPTALNVTHSMGEKERGPILRPRVERQGLCSPNMHRAGGQIEFFGRNLVQGNRGRQWKMEG